MNLVDSSGWLEYFGDGKNAKFFAPAIEDVKHLVVSTINLYEVFKRLLVEKNEESATLSFAVMRKAKILDVNPTIAVNAARISHELKIAMADSLIIATARFVGATIWTQDLDFKNIEGVKYFLKN